MIKPYNGAKAEKLTSARPLPAGGYVAKILKAEVLEYSWGGVLLLSFDIAEGDCREWFAKQYRANQNEDKKWKGTFRLTVPEEGSHYFESNVRSFNNFIASIEASNPDFHWDWDEQKLTGRLLDVLFRNREWEWNGQTGWTTECCSCTDVDAIREGSFKMPADKPLAGSMTAQAETVSPDDAVDDGDLPF